MNYKYLFIILLMVSTLPSQAQQTKEGFIDFIHLNKGRIVIDDSEYELPLRLKIYDINKQLVPRSQLRPRQLVEFESRYHSGTKKRIIKKIIVK